MGAAARWRSRGRRIGEQWTTWRGQWNVERDLEAAVGGTGPIVAGPWLSEVGYEVLYWIPFLRWVTAAYRIPSSRIVVLSRGGTGSWYRDLSTRYVEVFDLVGPDELAARAAGGAVKQREVSAFDQRLGEQASRALGLGDDVRMLHPSLMFRWFSPFWSGHETLSFVERHTRHVRIEAPDATLPIELPEEYIAVKFYGARSLPDEPAIQDQLRAMTEALSERFPIVQLDTGLGLDEHLDTCVPTGPRVGSVRGLLTPSTNLAVQTQIIAGARMFVGTCGSVSWLAPLLGVDTMPVFTDASFLHAHLHVARRVYPRVGGGRFSPLDLSGIMGAHLVVGSGKTHGGEPSSR